MSDADLTVHRLYGAYGEKKLYGKVYEGVIRSTFVIDGDGVIRVARIHPRYSNHERFLGILVQAGSHGGAHRAAKAAELEQWGRSIILLFPDETAYAKYAASPAASLPQTVTFGIDRDGSVRRQILDAMHLPGNVPLPVFIVGDTFNRVVFESHGYTIGLGDRFLHTIHQL